MPRAAGTERSLTAPPVNSEREQPHIEIRREIRLPPRIVKVAVKSPTHPAPTAIAMGSREIVARF